MLTMGELKDLDEGGLKAKIDELKIEVFKLRMEKKSSGAQKPHLLKSMKRDVARALTVLSQLEKEQKTNSK